METLTRGEAQNLVSEMQSQLRAIDTQIASSGFMGGAIDFLGQKRAAIQEALNGILERRGLVTEDDADRAWELMRSQTAEELMRKSGQTVDRLLTGVAVVAAVFIIYKLLK